MADSKIRPWLEKHEALRREGINLVVSENYVSPAVRAALASDLAGRYSAQWYGGGAFSRPIVEATEELAAGLFRARYALVTPLSGNLCDLAALFAFTAPGDKVAMLPFTAGGYPFGLEKFDRKRVDLPVKPATLEIDEEGALARLARGDVKLTILGASGIPFPHPVERISRAVKESGPANRCVYDGSHVLGLIACGVFQDPLKEGADVLMGSTHKTFFGPQGGLILTNSGEHAEALRRFLDLDLGGGIGLVDNPHINRIAALGLALEEMAADQDYGPRVVGNAQALARALDARGVPLRFKERGFTASHQVHLNLDPARAESLCRDLESIGIFIDIGGRIGCAEVTHRGMTGSDMEEIGEVFATLFHEGPGQALKERVRALAR